MLEPAGCKDQFLQHEEFGRFLDVCRRLFTAVMRVAICCYWFWTRLAPSVFDNANEPAPTMTGMAKPSAFQPLTIPLLILVAHRKCAVTCSYSCSCLISHLLNSHALILMNFAILLQSDRHTPHRCMF